MEQRLPDRPRKGRGAVSNRAGRYERLAVEATDDGWGLAEEEPPQLHTTLTRDTSKTVIARNESPDVPFDRSINPYRGCEHGCVYCFVRPSHAYLGLSPGLDFETRLLFKPDAARLLERELRRPGYRCQTIAMGTNTDPYQPVERRLGITREVLKVLSAFNHPVGIVTKSALVLRDLDILAPMAERGLARVCVSVTNLDRALAARLEPRAATPPRRIETIRRLAEAGIPVGVMVAPVIPALTDAEMESILETARNAGAGVAGYILLRLPREIAGMFEEWLAEHAPLKAERALALMRQARGGRAYDAAFGRRMTGTGHYAEMLGNRFQLACRRLGLEDGERSRLATDRFSPPLARDGQLPLF